MYVPQQLKFTSVVFTSSPQVCSGTLSSSRSKRDTAKDYDRRSSGSSGGSSSTAVVAAVVAAAVAAVAAMAAVLQVCHRERGGSAGLQRG